MWCGVRVQVRLAVPPVTRSRPVLIALVVAVGMQLRAVVLDVPPVLPAIRDDLHLSFTLAGTLTALPVLRVAPGRAAGHQPQPAGLGTLVRDRPVWHVAILFGGQSLIFYAALSWLPFELRPHGATFLSLVLLLLNLVNLPVVFLLLA